MYKYMYLLLPVSGVCVFVWVGLKHAQSRDVDSLEKNGTVCNKVEPKNAT